MNAPRPDPVVSRLARSMGRRDELPNIKLAEELIHNRDQKAIGRLAALLVSAEKNIQNDVIKVLCEIGAREPRLIAEHFSLLLKKASEKNNRMIWGALTAIAEISTIEPDRVFEQLPAILSAADHGSVIAKDQAMRILIQLKTHPQCSGQVMPLIFERLRDASVNQLPMYAEQIEAILEPAEHQEFREVLTKRLSDTMVSSKRKRITKILDRRQR